MRGKSSGGARQRTQQRDGDAASDRATQRDVYVSDVLERPELPEPLQVTAVHGSPAVRLILCTVVCTVCVCGSLLVSARYGSVGIGLLATTRAAKERSPVLAPGPYQISQDTLLGLLDRTPEIKTLEVRSRRGGNWDHS